jgi:hypothetical protein
MWDFGRSKKGERPEGKIRSTALFAGNTREFPGERAFPTIGLLNKYDVICH